MAETKKAAKERADKLLVQRGLAESREKAQALIMSAQVWSGEVQVEKAGQLLSPEAPLQVKGHLHPYVSRGGLKLEKALQQFELDPSGWVCLDIGASTGGFTDCLLQNGAERVYAVDVGYGQLAWSLRQDPRVINLERQNFRYLESGAMAGAIDLAVSDVSFISLRFIFARLAEFLKPQGRVVALIKPQFEAGRDKVGKHGVVRDASVHRDVLRQVQLDAYRCGLQLMELGWSPIKGPKGNIEFISCWRFGQEGEAMQEHDIEAVVAEAHVGLQV